MEFQSQSNEFFLDALLLLKANIIAEIGVTITQLKAHRRFSQYMLKDGCVDISTGNEDGIWLDDYSQILIVNENSCVIESEANGGGTENLDELKERTLIQILRYLQNLS